MVKTALLLALKFIDSLSHCGKRGRSLKTSTEVKHFMRAKQRARRGKIT